MIAGYQTNRRTQPTRDSIFPIPAIIVLNLSRLF